MIDVEHRKQLCIKTIQQYLINRKIEFAEYSSDSGSYYFHIQLGLTAAVPCIRVSDHPSRGTHVTSLIYTKFSKNLSNKQIRDRIIRTMNNLIRNSKTYSFFRCLEANV